MFEFEGEKYTEVRCGKCRKFILFESIKNGKLLKFCENCGEINKLHIIRGKHENVNHDKLKEIIKQNQQKGGE